MIFISSSRAPLFIMFILFNYSLSYMDLSSLSIWIGCFFSYQRGLFITNNYAFLHHFIVKNRLRNIKCNSISHRKFNDCFIYLLPTMNIINVKKITSFNFFYIIIYTTRPINMFNKLGRCFIYLGGL
jgi:hypothetical protein